ncbi:MAG: MBL fold metallo-hydrolase [Clostridia bacterium]|nr:MBL fold metallo-hydrolase [Clostridia bacterium]
MADKNKRSKGIILTVFSYACVSVAVLLYSLSGDGLESLKTFVKDPGEKEKQSYVRFISLPRGECSILHSNGETALIDVGSEYDFKSLCSLLDACDIERIDLLFISHLHSENIGGLEKLIEYYPVDTLVLPQLNGECEAADLAAKTVGNAGGSVFTVDAGQSFSLGTFKIKILAYFPEMKYEDDRSVIITAYSKGTKFLFMGDAGIKTEQALLDLDCNLNCDVLKVACRGDSTASGTEFLQAASPRYAVIPLSEAQTVILPDKEVLANLEYVGANTFFACDIRFDIQKGKLTYEISE